MKSTIEREVETPENQQNKDALTQKEYPQREEEFSEEQLVEQDEVVEILDKLPENEKEIIIQELHSGPLPSARQLKAYDDISPKISETIVYMAKTQQTHRHDMDRKVNYIEETAMKKHFFNDNLGMILGFLVLLVLIGAGVYLIINDHNITGFISMMAGLAGPASIFLKKNKNDDIGQDKKSDE